MLDFTLKLVDVFHAPMENDYVTPLPTLGFGVTPPEYVEWGGRRANSPGPFLSLVPAGVRLRDRWIGQRRNWAALLETRDIRAPNSAEGVEVRSHKEWVRIPWCIPVEPALVATMEMAWERIRELHREGLPASRLQARVRTVNMLVRFLEHAGPRLVAGPAARLKLLMDDDVALTRGLESLSRQCGYSPDHIRILFRQAYGMNPQHYRNRKRMSRAMDLVATSTQTIKEIGALTGFRHMSHFTALFSKEFGMTPRDACRKFRHCG